MIRKYSFAKDKNKMVVPHFSVGEFASINNSYLYTDDVLIDDSILEILEKLYQRMGCYKLIITSGYRCAKHEKAVGNASGTGYHVKGQAVDVNVWKNKNERYSSKEICLALESLEWNHGIGIISDTAVHIDSRTNKYFFNEKNGNKSIGDSFFSFYGEKTNREKVKERFGLDESTMIYLDQYKYANDLLNKLASFK